MIPRRGHKVESTLAKQLLAHLGPGIRISEQDSEDIKPSAGCLIIEVARCSSSENIRSGSVDIRPSKEWVRFSWDPESGGSLRASFPSFLYLAWDWLSREEWGKEIEVPFLWERETAFTHERSTFDLFLTQSGNEVSGSYAYEGGTIKGVTSGNRLDYTWTQTNGKKGRGYFIISDDGKTISGRYGYNDDNTGGGEWKGKKVEVPVSP